MTIILNLPPDVEDALTRAAQQQGTTPESLILDDIRRLYPALPGDDQDRRHDALARIIARARAVAPMPPTLEEDDPVGEAIADKFRRQGFRL